MVGLYIRLFTQTYFCIHAILQVLPIQEPKHRLATANTPTTQRTQGGARLRNVPNTDDSAHKRQRRALPGQRPEAKNNDLGSVD
jgi:hypothetical protein